ncbi:MAG: CD1871A family CXXC motif-containing protein [Oscillospiraceae bacterium]
MKKILNVIDTKYGRLLILLLAVVLIVIGVIYNEHSIVFKKAVNICLECIGVA